MNPKAQAALIALCLVAANWHWSRSIKTPDSTISLHIDGAELGLWLCGAALVVLLLRLYRLIRVMLSKPVRVPISTKLASGDPLFILLPLFVSVGRSYTITSEGAITTISQGYGSDASTPLFFVAAAVLLTFQIFRHLKRISTGE